MEQDWHINRFMDGSVFYIEFNHRPGRLTGNLNLRKAMQFANDSAGAGLQGHQAARLSARCVACFPCG